ncbi:MAG: threonylcarbamoyl-AMP synthase [Bacteroidia bacterium]|nr:MAG: threonylcarbamoyl-AMP synthase [Bacteroidia bacterium]
MQEDFFIDVENCVSALNNGDIILYPTDTIWGIGCDATNPNAVQKIFSIKQRNESKALIVLVNEINDVLKYTSIKDVSELGFLTSTVKPTTVIYENGMGLAYNLLAEDGSVGIRVCKDDFCSAVLQSFGKPIVSTSANISGEASPHFYQEIDIKIKQQVDYIVQYKQEDETPKEASSIVKWKDGKLEIIRP